MRASGTLTLLAPAESNPGLGERIALRGEFVPDARDYAFVYTSLEPACVALAEQVADRLWLRPRPLSALGSPIAMLKLALWHSSDHVIVVLPTAALRAMAHASHEQAATVILSRIEHGPIELLELSVAATDDLTFPPLANAVRRS
jgi:hypothetical protein